MSAQAGCTDVGVLVAWALSLDDGELEAEAAKAKREVSALARAAEEPAAASTSTSAATHWAKRATHDTAEIDSLRMKLVAQAADYDAKLAAQDAMAQAKLTEAEQMLKAASAGSKAAELEVRESTQRKDAAATKRDQALAVVQSEVEELRVQLSMITAQAEDAAEVKTRKIEMLEAQLTEASAAAAISKGAGCIPSSSMDLAAKISADRLHQETLASQLASAEAMTQERTSELQQELVQLQDQLAEKNSELQQKLAAQAAVHQETVKEVEAQAATDMQEWTAELQNELDAQKAETVETAAELTRVREVLENSQAQVDSLVAQIRQQQQPGEERQAARTNQQASAQVEAVSITFMKEGPLGMQLTASPRYGAEHVEVLSLRGGSQAEDHAAAGLRPGLLVASVAETSTAGLAGQDAVSELIQMHPARPLTVKFVREPPEVSVTFTRPGSLGLSLAEVARCRGAVEVLGLRSDGQAALHHPQVRAGLILVAVDGKSVASSSLGYDGALRLIFSAARPLTLRFATSLERLLECRLDEQRRELQEESAQAMAMAATEVEKLHARQQQLLYECRRAADLSIQNTQLAFSRGQDESELVAQGQLVSCRAALAEAHQKIGMLAQELQAQKSRGAELTKQHGAREEKMQQQVAAVRGEQRKLRRIQTEPSMELSAAARAATATVSTLEPELEPEPVLQPEPEPELQPKPEPELEPETQTEQVPDPEEHFEEECSICGEYFNKQELDEDGLCEGCKDAAPQQPTSNPSESAVITPFTAMARRLEAVGGLTCEGIFRVPGDKTEVEHLLHELDSLPSSSPPATMFRILEDCSDAHVLASALRSWLREQPSLIPTSDLPRFERLATLPAVTSEDQKQLAVEAERCVALQAEPGQGMLRELVTFLQKVDGDESKMTPDNLGMVFAPNLFYREDPMELMTKVKSDGRVISVLLQCLGHIDPLSGENKLTLQAEAMSDTSAVHIASPTPRTKAFVTKELNGGDDEQNPHTEEAEDEAATPPREGLSSASSRRRGKTLPLQMPDELTPARSGAKSAWQEGCRLFNDPESSSAKAIEYMEEHGLVEPNPAGVARLFREKAGSPSSAAAGQKLCKKEIGEYLAKLKPYNNLVREAYAETFDFTGRTFVDSLREYLRSFRLPGESMLIERLFSAWAARFYRNNPQDFAPALLTPEKVEKFRQAFDAAVAATPATESTVTSTEKSKAAGDKARSPGDAKAGKGKGKNGTAATVQVIQAGYLMFRKKEPSAGQRQEEKKQVRASVRGSKQGSKSKKTARMKRFYFELRQSAEAGVSDTLVYLDKPKGKEKGKIVLSMCEAAMPGLEDGTLFDVTGHNEAGEEVGFAFKCDNEGASMAWVNLIMMSLTSHVTSLADAAKERLDESGTIAFSKLNDTVRSLGGDFKYMKDPDLEEMKTITAKELRFVAPRVGHELSFKEAREMAERSQKKEGAVDFITFLTMLAFKAGFDCAFVLAYTTIMLNTDAHNPRLQGQKRLTCEQFIENNRRSPDLNSISNQYFEQLYKEILQNEIKMNDDDDDDDDGVKSGDKKGADEKQTDDDAEEASGGQPEKTETVPAKSKTGSSSKKDKGKQKDKGKNVKNNKPNKGGKGSKGSKDKQQPATTASIVDDEDEQEMRRVRDVQKVAASVAQELSKEQEQPQPEPEPETEPAGAGGDEQQEDTLPSDQANTTVQEDEDVLAEVADWLDDGEPTVEEGVPPELEEAWEVGGAHDWEAETMSI